MPSTKLKVLVRVMKSLRRAGRTTPFWSLIIVITTVGAWRVRCN